MFNSNALYRCNFKHGHLVALARINVVKILARHENKAANLDKCTGLQMDNKKHCTQNTAGQQIVVQSSEIKNWRKCETNPSSIPLTLPG